MNDQLLLKPQKTKYILILLGCLTGGIIAVLANLLFVTLCCLVGIIVAILMLLPNSSYLLLTPQGFTIKSLFKSSFISWQYVKNFSAGSFKFSRFDFAPGKSMVYVDFIDSYHSAENARAFVHGMVGHDGSIPETYGMKAADLANIMNQWLQKYRLSSNAA